MTNLYKVEAKESGMTDSQKWLLLLGFALLAGLVYLLTPVLTPFLISALLAYLGDPLVDRLEARKISRTNAVLIVFCGLFAAILAVILFVLPTLQRELMMFIKKIPAYIDWFQYTVLPWLTAQLSLDLETLNFDAFKTAISQHWQTAGGVAAEVAGAVSRSGMTLLAWVANLVLIPVLTFYLLRDWDVMVARVRELLPRRLEPRASHMAKDCDEVLGAFMHGQLTVMLCLGTVYAVGLWLVGLDMALLIGMMAGMVSFVPYLGFILGIVIAGVAAVIQFQELTPLLFVFAVFSVGQVLESFVLTPYLLGDRIGLHPVAVIFAVMAGGQLFGFFGVLLALPVAAVMMVMLRHAHERYVGSELYGQRN